MKRRSQHTKQRHLNCFTSVLRWPGRQNTRRKLNGRARRGAEGSVTLPILAHSGRPGQICSCHSTNCSTSRARLWEQGAILLRSSSPGQRSARLTRILERENGMREMWIMDCRRECRLADIGGREYEWAETINQRKDEFSSGEDTLRQLQGCEPAEYDGRRPVRFRARVRVVMRSKEGKKPDSVRACGRRRTRGSVWCPPVQFMSMSSTSGSSFQSARHQRLDEPEVRGGSCGVGRLPAVS
jgi:hypothetical protein